jgi:hypothetical protein
MEMGALYNGDCTSVASLDSSDNYAHLPSDIQKKFFEDLPEEPAIKIEQSSVCSGYFWGETDNISPFLRHEIIISFVVPFLNAKELLNVSCATKVLYQSLSTDVVVRSTMMGGERMLNSVKQIRDMCEKGAVWPMQPIRLLRLILGVVCEICGVNKVLQPRRGMAISACWHCCTKRRQTRRFYKRGEEFHQNPMLWNLALSHPRIFNGKRYGWRLVDDDDNDQKLWLENQGVGGRIQRELNNETLEFVYGYLANDYFTYLLAKQHFDRNGQKIGVIANISLVESILERVQLLEVANPNDVIEVVDDCLAEANVAPLDHDFYVATVSTFDQNYERAIQRIGESRDRKIMASDRYIQAKISGAERLITRLKKEIDDPSLSPFLMYKVNTDFANPVLRRRKKLSPINMTTLFMQRFLQKVLKKPSLVGTNKKLKDAASQVMKRCREEHSEEESRKLRRLKEKNGYFNKGEYIECYVGILEDSSSLILRSYHTEWMGGGSVLNG